jgi:hypothetical protein
MATLFSIALNQTPKDVSESVANKLLAPVKYFIGLCRLLACTSDISNKILTPDDWWMGEDGVGEDESGGGGREVMDWDADRDDDSDVDVVGCGGGWIRWTFLPARDMNE